MKKTITVQIKEPAVLLAGDITYGQRKAWGNAAYRPLKLSLMRPRGYIADKKQNLPLIVWLCGGAFTEVDRNIWIPEMVWFAKRGYAVASIDYSTTYRSRFPELVEDVRLAIRFLKANAGEYDINPERVALMGESAGGYLAALCAVTGKNKQFDTGGFEGYSSEVQAAIPWYPPVCLSAMTIDPAIITVPHDIAAFIDITQYVKGNIPPFLILHGNNDGIVPLSQGEMLYDSLQKAGAEADLIVLEGADHGDTAFVQPEIKQIILDFIKKTL
jgi:acetyl esterase/lipase